VRKKAAVNLRDFGQPWIPTAEQSGLLMRLAPTESVSLCARRKSCGFLKLEAAIQVLAAGLPTHGMAKD
jgi:hypothetical protein